MIEIDQQQKDPFRRRLDMGIKVDFVVPLLITHLDEGLHGKGRRQAREQ